MTESERFRSGMEYGLVFESRTEKHLERLLKTDKSLALDVLSCLEDLKRDPRPQGYRKLRGKSKGYRVRVREYRILYRIDDNKVIITVFKVGKRREVYKNLK